MKIYENKYFARLPKRNYDGTWRDLIDTEDWVTIGDRCSYRVKHVNGGVKLAELPLKLKVNKVKVDKEPQVKPQIEIYIF